MDVDKMYRSLLILAVSGFAFREVAADWPTLDTTTDTDFLYQQNQVYFNRKERFIKFDTKDNEIEVELGISVPFLTIPLRSELAKNHAQGQIENKITVNAAGVFIAGLLMLTSFIIVPLIFSKTNYKRMGFGRNSAGEESEIWRVLRDVDQVLSQNHVNMSECGHKAVCWLTKTSKGGKEGSIGKWIDNTLRTWWATRLINGTSVQDAVTTGFSDDSCAAKYPQCPITQGHLRLAFMTFLTGFSK